MLLAEGSSRACGCQHVAEKDCAVGGNQFARANAIEDLPIAVMLVADFDRSAREPPAVGGDPDGLPAVAFANHAVERDCGRTNRCAYSDDEIREHARAQFVLWVFDL